MKEKVAHRMRAKWPKKGICKPPSQEVVNMIKESKKWVTQKDAEESKTREPAPF